jgi:OOP family OmpA-OmpF porin
MKNLIILFMIAGLLFTQGNIVSAQIKNPLKKKVEKKVDKGLDNLEEGIGNLFKKDKNAESDKESKQAEQEQAQEQVQATETKQAGATGDSGKQAAGVELKWSKYDFVPGDKIIFEDNLIGEENGEFPSRWDLVQGTVENAQYGGENVIMFRGGSPTIIPYLKNPNIDYLPDVFTVEFDLLLPGESFTVFFSDRKNQSIPSGSTYLSIWSNKMDLSPASSILPDKGSIANKWAHIAIAYTEGKMKAYIDETRLINIPHLSFDPTGISLHAYHASDTRRFLIKNFRIAEGGVKYYDRFLQDGKIVSNGIRFDTGKSTLKSESMGVLNEIHKMLDEHPEVKVSIEGHTDNVGDNDMNQKLSEERAEAVRKQLVSMGIKAERLTSKGFGESKPINTNDTPEGKAENRRVEFVKM